MRNRNEQEEVSPDEAEAPMTEQERKVFTILREMDYGEVRIVVKASEIVQIEEKKSIKL